VSDHHTASTVKATVTCEQVTVLFGSELAKEWNGPAHAMDALLHAVQKVKVELLDLVASNHVTSHGKGVAEEERSALATVGKLVSAQQALVNSMGSTPRSMGMSRLDAKGKGDQLLASTRQALVASTIYDSPSSTPRSLRGALRGTPQGTPRGAPLLLQRASSTPISPHTPLAEASPASPLAPTAGVSRTQSLRAPGYLGAVRGAGATAPREEVVRDATRPTPIITSPRAL